MKQTPIRVLLADHDAEHRRRISEHLAAVDPQRYLVTCCWNGADALAELVTDTHDVCLMSLRLGAESGLELMAEARGRGWSRPTIILTADDDRSLDLEAMESGAVDFLVNDETGPRQLERSIRHAIQAWRTQAQLRLLEAAVQASGEGIMIVANDPDADMPIIFVNPGFERITGYSAAQVLGRNSRFLQGSETEQPGLDLVRAAILEGRPTQAMIRNYRADGTAFWNVLSISPVAHPNGTVSHFIGVLTDVTREVTAREEAGRLIDHDELTGLRTRAWLERQLEALAEGRDPLEAEIAVLVITVNGLRDLIDAFGYEAGEQAVVDIATRVRPLLEEHGYPARLGEAKFAGLLIGADAVVAATVGEQIIAGLHRPIRVQEEDVSLTANVGVSARRQVDLATTGTSLLQEASAAVRVARRAGQNTVVVHTPDLQSEIDARAGVVRRLRRALDDRALFLHYQPQYHATTGMLTGLEALVRWTDDALGPVPPSRFVAVAEESGLIVEIGRYVLGLACRQHKSWVDSGLVGRVPMAVNVSALELNRIDFVAAVEQTLATTGLDPALLELELTERIMVMNDQGVMAKLEDLNALGVRLAMDDFGTGYANFSMLRKLRLHKLKVDRSFIADITHSAEDMAIVDAAISIGRGLKMEVLAEGVETAAQLWLLQQHGCDQVQGYLTGAPCAAEELASTLRPRIRLPVQEGRSERTLLIVDDEPQILDLLRRVLNRDGYTILAAQSAEAALEHLSRHKVQVMIIDRGLPRVSGMELLRQVKPLYPDIVSIVISGAMDVSTALEAVNELAVFKLLTKPWNAEQLRAVVRQAFAHHGANIGLGR